MAEKGNIIGLAMGLDTSSLKAGLQDASRQIKNAAAEFSAASSGMDDWTKSTEGLRAKLTQLTKTLNVQEQVLEMLEKEYKDNYEGQDETSAAAVKLRTQILNQKAAINKTTKELKGYESIIEEVEAGTLDLEDVTIKSGEAIKKTKTATEKAEGGFTVLKGTMSNLLAQGITKLIGGFRDLATAALNTAESTREYRDDQAKLQAAFAQSNLSAETATQTYKTLFRAIGEEDTSVEAAQQLALLADSEEQVAKWAELATGVVGTFGDALKVETFYEAANETLKLGEATGAFTQMLEGTGVNVEDFNTKLASFTTEEEKAAYMLEVSKDALGKAGEEFENTNKSVMDARDKTAEFTETQAILGEKMEPVSAAITDFKDKVLETIIANVDFEDAASKVTDVLEGLFDALQWVVDNKDWLSALAGVIGGIAAAMGILNVVLGIQSAIMAANPTTWIILGIIAAIAALIGIFVLVIKNFDKIKAAGEAAWEWIKGVWETASTWFKENVIDPLVNFFKNLWSSITETFGNVKDWFTKKFKEAWEGVKSVFSKVGSFFSGIWDTIKEKFENIGQKVGDAISSTFKSAVNGLLTAAENVLNTPIKGINKAIGLLNKVPGVNIGTLTEFTLPRMALGGVVKRATTAIIGEDGAEAVIPLERNLGWLRGLARNLVSEMQSVNSGMSSIHNSNSTNFTQIINAPKQPPIDELYRRTGNLIDLSKVVTQ